MTNRSPDGLLLGGRELIRLVAGVTVAFVLLLTGVTVAFGTPADASTTPRPCSTHDQKTQGERGGRPCTPCPTVTPTTTTQPEAAPLTRTRPRPTCSPSLTPTVTPSSTPPTTRPTSTSPSASTSPSPSRSTVSPTPTSTATPRPPADTDDDDDTLPLTGPAGPILAGIAAVGIVGGFVLLYTVRRRRTRYVA